MTAERVRWTGGLGVGGSPKRSPNEIIDVAIVESDGVAVFESVVIRMLEFVVYRSSVNAVFTCADQHPKALPLIFRDSVEANADLGYISGA